jgi:predicted phosphodiesterase
VVHGTLFLNPGSRSRAMLEQSGIMGGKEKFSTSKYGIIFRYRFEGFTHGLDCEQRRVVLGSLFLNSGSCSRPKFEQSGIMGGKAKFPASKYGIIFGYPFEGCTSVIDWE